MKIASLDLGTNSLILVVAEWDGTTLTPLFEDVQVVRLGQGLAKRGSLHPKAKRRCFTAGKGDEDKFYEQIQGKSSQDYRAILRESPTFRPSIPASRILLQRLKPPHK